jgi:chromosome segregation ATPase
LKLEKASNEYQLKETTNKMNTLQSENRIHRTSSLKQNQKLETLNHEKTTLEQNRMSASIEMERLKASNIVLVQSKQDASFEVERLKASNASLEQLLKSKEDATIPLNGEIKNLSTANQFIIEMVKTQKSLLQSKTNEMELLRQNMEHLLVNKQQRIDTLEQGNQLLKQERAQNQTNAQNTRHVNNNDIRSTNIGTSHDDDAHNDINYDTELDDTEDDINYDTPSEDEEK